eukprot:494846_1
MSISSASATIIGSARRSHASPTDSGVWHTLNYRYNAPNRTCMHSGVLGGVVHEAMTDMIHLMASLVEPGTGKILVDGIMDDVDPVTEEERKLYESIEFDLEE